MSKVVVLGGGIAGLSAAHELVERGFEVAVFEASQVFGGKARSMDAFGIKRGALAGGKLAEQELKNAKGETIKNAKGETVKKVEDLLPAEHGFHFFPSFYRHLPDTMDRIPAPLHPGASQLRSVVQDLVPGDRLLLAREGVAADLVVPLRPTNIEEAWALARALLALGLGPQEVVLALAKLAELFTRLDDPTLESQTWWQFIDASNRSPGYQKFFGDVAVRWTVAMDPRLASARTIGRIAFQFWRNLTLQGQAAPTDRLLNGPANEVWIKRWKSYLESLGVVFRTGYRVEAIELDRESTTVNKIHFGNGERLEGFDYCISALPLKPMLDVLLDKRSEALKNADPTLRNLERLRGNCAWMLGMQFYLKTDVPLARGGAFLKDAPWAITVVSQTQFWQEKYKRFQYFNRKTEQWVEVNTVLSVIISNWNTPGNYQAKTAKGCTPEELRHEVWSELKAHFNNLSSDAADRGRILKDEDLVDFAYDESKWKGTYWENDEELFINLKDSWADRPEAVTEVPNFFLASDYVRTHTDLASMEAANEAARRAVNGILAEGRSSAAPCVIWPLDLDVGATSISVLNLASRKLGTTGMQVLKESRQIFEQVRDLWRKR